jgi:hypothetical protein
MKRHRQTFHSYFLEGLETASAITDMDADMKRDTGLATTFALVLITVALSGCGADDGSSSTAATSSTPAPVANDSATAMPATAAFGASASLTGLPDAASDPIAQNMQAILAADSQQVAPVMHYAPGDSSSASN